MTSAVYRFQVGMFDCTTISDGSFAYPAPAQIFFADAPEGPLGQALRGHAIEPQRWEAHVSPFHCLLVNTGRHLVLVDTGAGPIAPTTGYLAAHLRVLGVTPADIDTVILTHGHPDHIGGALDQGGKPAFPNARYVMARAEWEFWAAEPDLASLRAGELFTGMIKESARHNLPPIRRQLGLVQDGDAIVPGIRAVSAPGHTPGHLALLLESEGQSLLCLTDTVLHPLHLEHPGWTSVFDLDPAQTVRTRRLLLERAANDRTMVLAYHFPFPGLGNVVRAGDGWRWRPLVPEAA
ncbi:MAG TPA: MBL fold metallo-hydrolase [Chloroflexaceae bacterium]|nr:MBL fold metallo-hydrolase [Chloroflexaceae bacterium]